LIVFDLFEFFEGRADVESLKYYYKLFCKEGHVPIVVLTHVDCIPPHAKFQPRSSGNFYNISPSDIYASAIISKLVNNLSLQAEIRASDFFLMVSAKNNIPVQDSAVDYLGVLLLQKSIKTGFEFLERSAKPDYFAVIDCVKANVIDVLPIAEWGDMNLSEAVKKFSAKYMNASKGEFFFFPQPIDHVANPKLRRFLTVHQEVPLEMLILYGRRPQEEEAARAKAAAEELRKQQLAAAEAAGNTNG